MLFTVKDNFTWIKNLWQLTSGPHNWIQKRRDRNGKKPTQYRISIYLSIEYCAFIINAQILTGNNHKLQQHMNNLAVHCGDQEVKWGSRMKGTFDASTNIAAHDPEYLWEKLATILILRKLTKMTLNYFARLQLYRQSIILKRSPFCLKDFMGILTFINFAAISQWSAELVSQKRKLCTILRGW